MAHELSDAEARLLPEKLNRRIGLSAALNRRVDALVELLQEAGMFQSRLPASDAWNRSAPVAGS